MPEPDREAAAAPTRREPEEPGSLTGTYLTDGRSLFLVQHTITESEGLHLQEPLLELEDCKTMELILCSAGALARLGLRPVKPAAGRTGALVAW
ncbi:MAG TPA: hypothetical protein VNV44_09625 [Solirubrobacteraceae bacterium]|nr:hypothetical protein [Solirubrobacteraceae bacterium]